MIEDPRNKNFVQVMIDRPASDNNSCYRVYRLPERTWCLCDDDEGISALTGYDLLLRLFYDAPADQRDAMLALAVRDWIATEGDGPTVLP